MHNLDASRKTGRPERMDETIEVRSCFAVKQVDQCHFESREPPMKGRFACLAESLFVTSRLGMHIFHFGHDKKPENAGTSDLKIVLGESAAEEHDEIHHADSGA